MSRAGLLRCAAAAVLFGAATPLAVPLARQLSAPTLAGLLYLGAALAMAPQALQQRPPGAALRASSTRLATAVLVGGAAGPLLLALGLARTSAASASLLLNLELVFTVLLAGLFFREHIGARVAAGAGVVAGASVLLGGWGTSPTVRLGAVFVAAACLCWAVDNCVTSTVDSVPPAVITVAKGLIAGTANLAIGLASGPAPSLSQAAAAVGIGAVGYGVSITLWVTGARDLGAARGQVVFSAAPFVGVLLAWSAFHNPVRPGEIVAMVLLLGGIALVVRSDHAHAHEHRPVEHAHEHRHDAHHPDHQHSPGTPDRHTHPHRHEPLAHSHPHLPDLHHRHEHTSAGV